VHNNIIPESRIDELVYPILEQKFKLGLFENPYINPNKLSSIINNPSSAKLALDAAHESIILLKNANNFAPVEKSKIKTIAIIGPHANNKIIGNVALEPKVFITVYEGIRRKLLKDNIKVLTSDGCKITVFKNKQLAWQEENDAKKQIDSAVNISKQADVVVLALGSSGETSNFNVDNSTLSLPGFQESLFDAINKTGKPIVLLVFGDKPFALPTLYSKASTVLLLATK
jgi:beta-glucosidase